MRFFKRKPPRVGAPESMPLPGPQPEGVLHERILPELRERAADKPRLMALLEEVERGQARASKPPAEPHCAPR